MHILKSSFFGLLKAAPVVLTLSVSVYFLTQSGESDLAKDSKPDLLPNATESANEQESVVRVNQSDIQIAGLNSDAYDYNADPVRFLSKLSIILVAVSTPSQQEIDQIERLLQLCNQADSRTKIQLLEDYLQNLNFTAYRQSLLANLATLYRHIGAWTNALNTWKIAWQENADSTDPMVYTLANQALGEYAGYLVTLGREEDLAPLLDETKDRQVGGAAAEQLSLANSALYQMRERTDQAFKCGPFALFRVRKALGIDDPAHDAILQEPSSKQGTNMQQLQELAADLGMDWQVARRLPGADLPTPAVVRWKLGHYSAILDRLPDGRYRVEDTAFATSTFLDQATLDSEADGHYLIAASSIPKQGWEIVGPDQASKLWGRMSSEVNNPQAYGDQHVDDSGGFAGGGGFGGSGRNGGGKGDDCGMPVYGVSPLNISLWISDTPCWYHPAFGPSVAFRLRYNHREINQSVIFNHTHTSQLWTNYWHSYVQDDPETPQADVFLYKRGGGGEYYRDFDSSTQTFDLHHRSLATLERREDGTYVRTLSNLRKEIFAHSDGVVSGPRKYYLSQIVDRYGHALTFHYDTYNRIEHVEDATGALTQLHYTSTEDPWRLTKVTLPDGRSAQLAYNEDGRLSNITDMAGLTSSLEYDASDFIVKLTTPYGSTTFDQVESGFTRQITSTDPQGERQRWQYTDDTSDGTYVNNRSTPLNRRLSRYWDRKGMQYGEGENKWAWRTNWLYTRESMYVVSDIPARQEGPKPTHSDAPSKIYTYEYPGQTNRFMAGDLPQPSIINDESFQYNAQGKLVYARDALGRTTNYHYAENGIDLLKVTQSTSFAPVTLISFADYNNHGQATKMTDASGQTTLYTYNSRGQVILISNALGQQTHFIYQEIPGLDQGRLMEVLQEPNGGSTFYSYDPKKMSRMVFKSGAIGQVVFRQPLENEIRQHH